VLLEYVIIFAGEKSGLTRISHEHCVNFLKVFSL
jgi:hypothetical protein